jgi:L-alanine-DL-glutamate epimerase-like enolase superfamily enzyme
MRGHVNRRQFIRATATAAAIPLTTTLTRPLRGAEPSKAPRSAKITRVSVQLAKGRRLTPVAPNAYAPYRGYDVNEPIIRVRTADGVEGFGRQGAKPDVLKRLVGLDPFALFDWDGDGRVRGAAEGHRALLADLGGSDVALFDLLGKLVEKPVADLLGKRVRDGCDVYDASLYMEDLLKPEERGGLAFLVGTTAPDDPAEMVALKAKWLIQQPGGIRIFKIKLGRVKWMADLDQAIARDVAVVKATRRAVGPDVVLFVDGNNGYDARPLGAADFALATKDDRVYAMEEMFSERMADQQRDVKSRIRAAGVATKIADGESERDGVSEALCAIRVPRAGGGDEPLFDINQPDMNANGFLRMAAIAAGSAKHGITVAPHNFGSKVGFYSMLHSALVTPNWEFCETDDSQFPAFRPEGIVIKRGRARLAGMPGLGVTLDESKLERPTFVAEA